MNETTVYSNACLECVCNHQYIAIFVLIIYLEILLVVLDFFYTTQTRSRATTTTTTSIAMGTKRFCSLCVFGRLHNLENFRVSFFVFVGILLRCGPCFVLSTRGSRFFRGPFLLHSLVFRKSESHPLCHFDVTARTVFLMSKERKKLSNNRVRATDWKKTRGETPQLHTNPIHSIEPDRIANVRTKNTMHQRLQQNTYQTCRFILVEGLGSEGSEAAIGALCDQSVVHAVFGRIMDRMCGKQRPNGLQKGEERAKAYQNEHSLENLCFWISMFFDSQKTNKYKAKLQKLTSDYPSVASAPCIA